MRIVISFLISSFLLALPFGATRAHADEILVECVSSDLLIKAQVVKDDIFYISHLYRGILFEKGRLVEDSGIIEIPADSLPSFASKGWGSRSDAFQNPGFFTFALVLPKEPQSKVALLSSGHFIQGEKIRDALPIEMTCVSPSTNQ